MIKLSELLDESEVSDEARRLGLDYMSFGRWGKDGKVTHVSRDGQLIPITPQTSTSEPEDEYNDADVDIRRMTSMMPKGKMKPIPRIPSLNKRIGSRTSINRILKNKGVMKMPKGGGWLTRPQKTAYNKIYNLLTFGL